MLSGSSSSIMYIFPQVTTQTDEVIHCRLQQRNMVTTVEKLQLCIPGTAHVCQHESHCISRVISQLFFWPPVMSIPISGIGLKQNTLFFSSVAFYIHLSVFLNIEI